jgi:PAS domain-containing protein
VDKGSSPDEIDKIIKIDDGPVLSAIVLLDKKLRDNLKASNSRIVEVYQQGDTFALIGLFLAPVFLVGTLFSKLLLRRFSNEYSERANRLEAVLNSTVDGIITIDDREIVETLNNAAEEIFR